MRNAVLATELDHRRRAGNAQLCLQRPWLVVDPGMNDAAVVAALMPGYAIFLLEQQRAKAGESLGNLERDGEADNASADDDDVVVRVRHDR